MHSDNQIERVYNSTKCDISKYSVECVNWDSGIKDKNDFKVAWQK